MKKFLIPFLAGIFLVILIAAQPKIGDRAVVLETNGFATNLTVAKGISIGATNILPLLATANRPAFIGSDGTVTNVSGTPTGSQFVRDDGVLAVPAGTAGNPVWTNDTGATSVQALDLPAGVTIYFSYYNGAGLLLNNQNEAGINPYVASNMPVIVMESFNPTYSIVTLLDGMQNYGDVPYYFNTATNELSPSEIHTSFANWNTNIAAIYGNGALSLSGQTNRYSDDGSQLLRDGVPVGGGDQVWTNSGSLIWPAGQPAPDITPPQETPGPGFFFRTDGSGFYGTNVAQVFDPTTYGSLTPVVAVSILDSNDPPTIRIYNSVTENDNYSYFTDVDLLAFGDKDQPLAYLNMWAAGTNHDCFVDIRVNPDGPTGSRILMQRSGSVIIGLQPSIADSSINSAHVLNTVDTMVDAKLLSVQNRDVEKFTVAANGNAYVGGTVNFGATVSSPDVTLGRNAASILQLGTNAATPPAQTFKGPDGVGTDKTGGDLTIEPGQSTGTGRGGALIEKTSLSSTTGSSANSYTTRSYVSAKEVTLTESTATLTLNVSLASGKTAGIRLMATTRAGDGTDFQVVTETLAIAAANKAGTVTTSVSAPAPGSTLQSSGTLTTTWTAVANGNGIDVKNNAVSSLTQTTLAVRWRIEIDSDDAPTVTAQ